eukprot:CAMPEP_0176047026 /NCGR_PEP_ID=MMETSP0120_2-20121206/23354_1 /TAXON_ID=160619 /ORGANISM="Kryptoperidinium foliaceum, Strain CCMP 1326" /LENGTH=906 /DNA_ID=CAMNT_0017380441 /DNA_START=69 /DNA_END=2786 /DNA_ORIENTATION=-
MPVVGKAAAKQAAQPADAGLKRKAEGEAADGEEPPAKEAKVEEEAETELDDKPDRRAALKEAVGFRVEDTTLNAVPTLGDTVLATLTDGGMQYLIAGARASVGMKAGRYAFELKVIEALQTSDLAWPRGTPKPRQLVRLGFSTSGSSLLLGESEEHVFFDSDGAFTAGKQRTFPSAKFGKDEVITVLLNLSTGTPNANTLSIFKDGVRISKPQALPEQLKGKPLFPHVSYRNVTVQVNFGPSAMQALPFKCRLVGAAASADTVTASKPQGKAGKCEVVLPVGYPDEGTFEWLDDFLAKNPQYVELSDRKVIEWAIASGMWKPRGHGKGCLDKPDFNFGLPGMDDFSIRKVLSAVTAAVPRNYVVMEVKANLVEEDRKRTLARFSSAFFTKTAYVVMGEPTAEYKDAQLAMLLKDKQEKADLLFRAHQVDKARKKEIAKRQKVIEEQRKKIEDAAKKKAEGASKESEDSTKMQVDSETKKEEGASEVTKAEGEVKEESKDEKKEDVKDEPADADATMETKEEEDEPAEPPKVELTDEEKKTWFRTKQQSDLKSTVFDQCFASFTLPQQSEGFDSIKYLWQDEAAAKEYLHSKVLAKKKVTRLELLQPSEWFNEKLNAWKKLWAEWQKKQADFKASPEQTAKAAARQQKSEDGEDKGENEEEEGETEVRDIFSVENVCDIGDGSPLFKDFLFEDWALAQLRYELFLLAHAFRRDVNDEDRPGVPEEHLAFYYQKYYKKQLSLKLFGVESNAELAKLVKDTVAWSDDSLLTATLSLSADDDVSHFIKLTEEARRERQRRLDAGDESARLKLTQAVLNPPPAAPSVGGKPGQVRQQSSKGGGGWYSKGGGKSWGKGGGDAPLPSSLLPCSRAGARRLMVRTRRPCWHGRRMDAGMAVARRLALSQRGHRR